MLTKEDCIRLCMNYQKEKKLKEAEARKKQDDECKAYIIANHLRIERRLRGCRR